MTPELVIFDCDGVLVDSEALSVSALLGMIERAGGTVSEDAAYEHFLGKSMKSVREILGRDFGLEISDQHLTAMRVDLMRKFREELKPIPGVKEMLPKLGLPFCVASSGTLERIRYALDVTGLLGLMEPHLFSAAMVAKGKPASRRRILLASRLMRPARWWCATGKAISSAFRPRATSAGTPSSGSTTAPFPKQTNARRAATRCSTI